MKNIIKNISIGLCLMMASGACTDAILNDIDTDPNNPTDVPINLLLPKTTIDVFFTISGTDLAWYSSVFVEQTTGVHGQLQDATRRQNINPASFNNSWNGIYAGTLKDLQVIIISERYKYC
jgi:hypothetical protein